LSDPGRQAHWQDVYKTKGEQDLNWFQEASTISFGLIGATGVAASVIDIGGGALGRSFELVETRRHDHQRLMGTTQRFQFGRFRRKNQ
jgi:hypothetical protein